MKRMMKKFMNISKDIDYKRFYSHIFQVYLVESLNPKEILEIGKGDGTVSNLISDEWRFVTTLDNDMKKTPHINTDITDLGDLDKLPDNYYDLVLMCEVLEHIPYEIVEGVLEILKKKTKKYIIISVPDQSKYLHTSFSKHGIRDVHFFMKVLNWFLNQFNSFWVFVSKMQYKLINKKRPFKKQREHQWELGIDKYSVKGFKEMLEKHFDIILDERVKEFPWHHFYVLEKKEEKGIQLVN